MNKQISLPLAKKLHDACIKFGVKEIESEYVWTNAWLDYEDDEISCPVRSKYGESLYIGKSVKGLPQHYMDKEEWDVVEIPAPDCSELGEVLPDNVEYEKGNGYFYAKIVKNGMFFVKDKTEVECRGEMYLWLIINGYIKHFSSK